MTPTEINAINRTLAGFVGKDAHYFKPALCRNDLAEVAAKLTDDQWSEVEIRTRARSSRNSFTDSEWTMFLFTCDPAEVAKVIAEIVNTPAR